MRVRITKTLKGSIDGIQLSRLATGQVYDVNSSLACYLLSEKLAELAQNDEFSKLETPERSGDERPLESRKGAVLPRSLAADRRRLPKPKKADK